MTPDYRTPSPDAGHEAIRAPLAQAIDDLSVQVDRLDGALLLHAVTADFAQSVLDALLPLQSGMAALQQAVADLTARVAALEAPPTPTPAPTGGGTA